ncbi:MAG: hypothetical protein LKI03_05910 [Acetobacter indonesiensis]|uniref:hypothetical protein n=1 Tax=Acetobacter indonesiensis TaxID=104101 RepID=UPI001F463FB2|nr:hypothetical protein [Acetobacter indonesiensis]MCG0995975.1 hypothetical protein [Acetobacter indonesiensis]MCI1437114.1 hypothetical protein [Acetobacter indonesiensis]MCI1546121.1 hypothetical protein [Acetobacter indonesiensis]MCI1765567.1 hypothetical protein [Acetobacter indonesiensis]
MKTIAASPLHAVTPEDILQDDQNQLEINGTFYRKGTIAAFLRNAHFWCQDTVPPDQKQALTQTLQKLTPALAALGVFDVFEIRDERLRALVSKVINQGTEPV